MAGTDKSSLGDIFGRISSDLVRMPDRFERDELVRLRLNWLKPQDRGLLDMYLNQNVSLSQLSQVSGLSRSTVRRRLRDQMDRLLSEDYARILRQRDILPDDFLAAAYDRLLLGLGYRRIAERQKMTEWQARRLVQRIDDYLLHEHNRYNYKESSVKDRNNNMVNSAI